MAAERNETETVTATDFQRNVGGVLYDVSNLHREVIVQTHGRDTAAIIPVSRYEALKECEKQLTHLRIRNLARPGD